MRSRASFARSLLFPILAASLLLLGCSSDSSDDTSSGSAGGSGGSGGASGGAGAAGASGTSAGGEGGSSGGSAGSSSGGSAGSGGGAAGSSGGASGGAGAAGESFSAIWSEILAPTCATSSCHGNVTKPKGGLLLGATDGSVTASQARANLIDQPTTIGANYPRVKPGKPDESFLVTKLEVAITLKFPKEACDEAMGKCGDPMPQGKAPLEQAKIDRIRAWIAQGAGDN